METLLAEECFKNETKDYSKFIVEKEKLDLLNHKLEKKVSEESQKIPEGNEDHDSKINQDLIKRYY